MEQPFFSRYEHYKPTGVDWIGEIPNGWEVKSVRAVLIERKEKNDPVKTKDILSLCMYRGVIPYSEKGASGNKAKEDLTAYRLAYPGDIVLNSMNVIVGSVGLSKYFGAVSPVYYMLRPRNEEDCVEYFNAIFQTVSFQKYLSRLGSGILIKKSESSGKLNTIRMKIPMLKLNMERIPYPPPDEQRRIANFLDQKTAEIDEAIAKKQRLIELLKEQKAILINQAVTKGLNPDVPMRDSGVEWIGEIPAHWVLRKNRELFTERKEVGSDLLPILSVSLHTGVSDKEQDENENLRAKIRIEDKSLYRRVYPGDIAFNMMRAWQGAIGVVRVDGQVSPAYIIAKPLSELDGEYFEYLYRTDLFIGQMDRFSKGITDFRKRLYWDEFKQLSTICPPIQEQREISRFVSQLALETGDAVLQVERQIAGLNEYRTCLISEAVTGKIKL